LPISLEMTSCLAESPSMTAQFCIRKSDDRLLHQCDVSNRERPNRDRSASLNRSRFICQKSFTCAPSTVQLSYFVISNNKSRTDPTAPRSTVHDALLRTDSQTHSDDTLLGQCITKYSAIVKGDGRVVASRDERINHLITTIHFELSFCHHRIKRIRSYTLLVQ